MLKAADSRVDVSFSGYFNIKNISFKFLHSCKKKSGVDDEGFARSSIVLKSDRLYLLSTGLNFSSHKYKHGVNSMSFNIMHQYFQTRYFSGTKGLLDYFNKL